MLDLIRFLYQSDPMPITIRPFTLMCPLIYPLSFLSLVLLIPIQFLPFALPVFLFPLLALVSYSRIYKSYYGNTLFYWFIVAAWLILSFAVLRPLVWLVVRALMGW